MGGEHVEKCKGCGEMIDPDTCWCGQSIDHEYDNHTAIPMGCNCYRDSADAPFDGVEPGLGRVTYFGNDDE